MADGSGFCTECGQPALGASQKFCGACGHNLQGFAPTYGRFPARAGSTFRPAEPSGTTEPKKNEVEAGEPLLEVRNGRFQWSWRWGGPLVAGTWTGILLTNVIDNPDQARVVSIIAFVVVVFGGVLLSTRLSPD